MLLCAGMKFLLTRTLTTPVEVLRCLRSIKEYAFEASPYPVIITLEDHLTTGLQAKVAQVTYYVTERTMLLISLVVEGEMGWCY